MGRTRTVVNIQYNATAVQGKPVTANAECVKIKAHLGHNTVNYMD